VLTFFISRPAELIVFIFSVIFIGICFSYFSSYRLEFVRTLVAGSFKQPPVQVKLLKKLSIPYILLDSNGKVYWTNESFEKMFPRGSELRLKNIRNLFPEMKEIDFPLDEEEEIPVFAFEDKMLRMEITPAKLEGLEHIIEELPKDVAEELYYTACFYDVTRELSLESKLEEERLIVGLLYLDNYDEIMGTIEEAKQNLIGAHIERKIGKYFSQTGGLIRKLEKDKYFLILPQKAMKRMQEDKFYILDEIRAINLPNEQSVTISIGLGLHGESYERNYEYARTAIDMALGRGGDQVVIKDNEEISYVGGQAQTVVKNTRVKARVKAHALRELLTTKDSVIIMGHKIPDFDAIGAAVGVYRIAFSQGKKAYIVLNEISTSIRPIVELLNTIPEYSGNLFITSEQAMELINENTVLVIVDANRGSYTECPELLEKSNHTVVLDHHRQSKDSITDAVLSYVEPYASSACELVTEIIQYSGDNIKLNALEADTMYAGIAMDTGQFSNKTGVRTFEAAAFLRRCGADMSRVRKLFREHIEEYRVRAETVRNAEIFENRFAISICPAEGLESPTIAGAQAANELLNIIGVGASIVLTRYQDSIYISARSIDEINVQLIMEKLGGGGHGTMAGAQMAGCTLEEAKEYVKVTIKQMLEDHEI
jgi:c-di-AMP phosphodiesterase-like protein